MSLHLTDSMAAEEVDLQQAAMGKKPFCHVESRLRDSSRPSHLGILLFKSAQT